MPSEYRFVYLLPAWHCFLWLTRPSLQVSTIKRKLHREVVERLVQAGRWRPRGPDILTVTDAGDDVTRLAYLLSDLPVGLVGRLRSDRVMLRDAGPRRSGPQARRRPPL